MAKEDFCFTYYDGDAARDKAHMTRLCRGAYDDIISMQRKVGHLDIETIQMVLSSDFDLCWKSLIFILKQDESGKYFIEWVDRSIETMKKNAARQKEKIDKYWQDVKDGSKPRNKKSIPQNENNNTDVEPLEDVNVNGNEIKEKGVHGKKQTFVANGLKPGQSEMELPLSEIQKGAVQQYIKITKQKDVSFQFIDGLWNVFKVKEFTGKNYYPDVGDIFTHFMNGLKFEKIETTKLTDKLTGPSYSEIQARKLLNSIG